MEQTQRSRQQNTNGISPARYRRENRGIQVTRSQYVVERNSGPFVSLAAAVKTDRLAV